MSLINCEVNLILTGSWACAITNTKGPGRFAITDAKLYVPVVTLCQIKMMQNYFNN